MTTISKICVGCSVEIASGNEMDKCYMCKALEGCKSMVEIECTCRLCGSPFYLALDVFFEKAMLISDLNIISLRDKKTDPLVSCITPDCLGYEFRLSLVEGASIG